jgi:hypothetical protein
VSLRRPERERREIKYFALSAVFATKLQRHPFAVPARVACVVMKAAEREGRESNTLRSLRSLRQRLSVIRPLCPQESQLCVVTKTQSAKREKSKYFALSAVFAMNVTVAAGSAL